MEKNSNIFQVKPKLSCFANKNPSKIGNDFVSTGTENLAVVVKTLKFGRVAATIALSVLLTTPAWAHHSFAMFDMHKTVDLKGTIKEFHWTNPHSLIVLTILGPGGKSTDIDIEANGPGYLVRQGWKRESLKPGDAVTATINPLHDGSPGGSLVKMTLMDGRELSALPKIPGVTPPGAGDASAK